MVYGPAVFFQQQQQIVQNMEIQFYYVVLEQIINMNKIWFYAIIFL